MLISANDSQAVTYFKNSNTVSITFDGEYLDITTNTDNNGYYCGLYWQTSTTTINNIKLSDLLEKTLQLDLELQLGDNVLWLLNVYDYSNGAFHVLTTKQLVEGENSIEFTVPTGIDRLWVRIQPSNRNTSHNCKTKNWRIGPV